MNGYELSRHWFDWCFENPEKVSPNHTALYFFCVEHCNRLGWKEKFGLPTTMAKEAIGIRSYNTYINTLNDLVSFGFIILIEKSKNQYSSNIVALSNFNKTLDKAPDKALDKAMIKHTTKQCESTGESISSIIKQETNNKEQKKPNDAKNDFRKRAREFYDKELLTTEDSRYKVFVEYLFGANSGKIEFKRVLRIEHQLNYQQFCYLLDKCKNANIKLMDIIEQLENYEKRKYTVLFSVLKNWIARDAKMKGAKP